MCMDAFRDGPAVGPHRTRRKDKGMARKYDPRHSQTKWQKVWDKQETFIVSNPAGRGRGRQGCRRHVHPGDARSARAARTSGRHSMGHGMAPSGAVGTEGAPPHGIRRLRTQLGEYGHKNGEPPAKFTEEAIATINRQLRRLGVSIDWTREVVTSRPEYYKWTQWLFLQLYKQGLAYRKEAPVNWCPSCNTVLANERVVDALRALQHAGHEAQPDPVVLQDHRLCRRADREKLDRLIRPEKTKMMQRNWIGKSVGADACSGIAAEGALGGDAAAAPPAEDPGIGVTVFTTRPDTLFGATFFILAPEHPLVDELVAGTPQEQEVRRYVAKAMATSAIERASVEKEKTGVFTGRSAINPVDDRRNPNLDRGLCAHGLWHGRHHGGSGARLSRLCFCAAVRSGGRRGHRQSRRRQGRWR